MFGQEFCFDMQTCDRTFYQSIFISVISSKNILNSMQKNIFQNVALALRLISLLAAHPWNFPQPSLSPRNSAFYVPVVFIFNYWTHERNIPKWCNFPSNCPFLVKKSQKFENFKIKFLANCWMFQHKTNSSNTRITWIFC